MAKLLKQFLKGSTSEQFEWGNLDCAMWVSNWIELNTGVDLVKDIRGTYSTEKGCGKFLVKNGGVEGLLDRLMPPVADRVDGPSHHGDIAIFPLPNVGDAVCIRTGVGWAVKNLGLGYTVYGPGGARYIWRLKCLQQ